VCIIYIVVAHLSRKPFYVYVCKLDIPGAHELWAVEPAGQYWVALHASLTSGVAHWKPPGHVEAAVVFSGQYCVALQG
jgi:hypothetical protein